MGSPFELLCSPAQGPAFRRCFVCISVHGIEDYHIQPARFLNTNTKFGIQDASGPNPLYQILY